MFSSTYSSNTFSCFPSSSSYPPLPFFIDPENCASNTLLLDPLAVPFIPTHDAPIPEALSNLEAAGYAAMLKQNAIFNGNGAHYGSSISNFLTKKPAKKDRHSKIHTSQGLRDRRVRLSSEIAHKFFDLQEMLEHDKPSNTLEWLFTKSENAIQEVARSKHSCGGPGKCFCFSSELQGLVSNEKSLVGAGASTERKLKWAEKENACVHSKKGSREKARARTRTRTSYKRLQDLEERFPATANPQILHQLKNQDCARWPKLVHPHPHPHLVGGEAPRDGFNVIEESIVRKRNFKPSLLSSHYQNFAIPKESSFNNNDFPSFPNSPPNWDTTGGVNGRSNFCGVTSMNLSTELQIFGKSWEECTNQRRH